MSTVPEELGQGPVNPQPNRRGIIITLAVIAVIALLAAGFGVASTLIGRERRNENILPRLLEIYALLPEESLRYVRVVRPADPQLVDDELPFEPEERTISGPLYINEAAIVRAEVFGGTLIGTTPEVMGGGGQTTEYTIRRELTDGQVFGVDITLSGTPLTNGETFTLTVGPQTTDAQRIIAVAVPVGGQVLDVGGFSTYREATFDGWQVYYFDVTLIEEPQTIVVRYNIPPGTDAPDIETVRFEVNR